MAGMRGMGDFPDGYYDHELEMNDAGQLRIHFCYQDWVALANDEGRVVYDLVQRDRYEYVSKDEAKQFYWDWVAVKP